jgi:hypothetical protein
MRYIAFSYSDEITTHDNNRTTMLAPAALAAEIATADDTAKFLAGLSPLFDSPLVAFTKDEGWQQHASRFDALFGEEQRTHLSRVRVFAKEQLSPHNTLLYMFSGPDALHGSRCSPMRRPM